MQAAAAIAASDLDVELMELVERSTELVGARGSTAYTLRFVHGDTDLLLRVAVDGDRSRVDGWIVPPEPMTVAGPRRHRAAPTTTPWSATRAASSSPTCPSGCCGCGSSPTTPARPAFATPTFEI